MTEQDFIGLHLIDEPDYDEIVPVILELKPAVVKNYEAGAAWFVGLLQRLISAGFVPQYPIHRFSYNDPHIGADNELGKLLDYATIYTSEGSYINPSVAWDGWRNAVTWGGLQALQSVGIPIYVNWINEQGFDLFQEGTHLSSVRLSVEREWAAQLHINYPNLHPAALSISTGASHEDIYKACGDHTGVGLVATLWEHGGILDTHAYADGFLQNWYGSAQAIQGNPNVPGLDYHYHEHPSYYVNNPEVLPLQLSRDSGFLIARPLKEVEWWQKYGGGAVPTIVGETGYDRVGFQSFELYIQRNPNDANGWRDIAKYWGELGFLEGGKSPARFYAEQLHWMRRVYEPESFGAPGCAIYVYGSEKTDLGEWRSFNIRDAGGGSAVIREYVKIREDNGGTPPDSGKGCSLFSLIASGVKAVLGK